jgi:Flp pilus assembly pilin Flp
MQGSFLKTLARRDEGQDLAEYAIALAVIAVGVALIAIAIGGDVTTLWSNAQPTLQTVIDAEP